jgi:hypothetical protein
MLSKKGCQQHYQNIVKIPQNISLYSCVFHYLGIHDAFPLVYLSFNDDLKPHFKVFGNVFIFFTNNFIIKSDLTSTLSSSLHVYYKFRRLVIKKLLQGDNSRFLTPGVTWDAPSSARHQKYTFYMVQFHFVTLSRICRGIFSL